MPVQCVLKAVRAPVVWGRVSGASVAWACGQGLLHPDMSVPCPAYVLSVGLWALPADVS